MSDKFDEIIKERIDSIAPEDGAGERMLENIKRKAANGKIDSEESKVIPWKKIAAVLTPLAACVAIVIAVGISGNNRGGKVINKTSFTEDSMGYANEACKSLGLTESSAEEVKDNLGIEFTIPEGAYDAEYYITAENEATVRFLYNGHEYEITACKNAEDVNGNDAEDELLYEVKWTEGEVTYTLINWDGADPADIDAVYNETKSDEN
ncbi:MAG: hypothetical protein IJT81_06010 [Lachnospiraceae bacterium]|nr:hypothetical protein [Lachnospiraceae bacterium]